MIDEDEFLKEMMAAVIAPFFEQMTDEQAAKDAIADFHTERQQASMMGGFYE